MLTACLRSAFGTGMLLHVASGQLEVEVHLLKQKYRTPELARDCLRLTKMPA
jgi:hypothetical protein